MARSSPIPAPIPAPAPAPAPVVFNGQQYAHLPANLALQLAALPAMPALPQQRRHRQVNNATANPVSFFFMVPIHIN